MPRYSGLVGVAAAFTLIAAAAFLPGCVPSDGELTAEQLTEVEKETLGSLADELSDIEETQQRTEEDFYSEVADFNEKIRVQRHESIARYEEIVKESEELDKTSPYLEEVFYNLGDLYYGEAKDLYEDDAYRERVLASSTPEPTAADTEPVGDSDIVIRTFKKSMKA
jgi:hypothetical protein